MRVNVVEKARKDQGRCGACGEPVVKGQGYRYIKPRYGPKQVRHLGCAMFRPSEMTSSKIATAYAGQEAAEDGLAALDLDAYVAEYEPWTAAGWEAACSTLLSDIRSALEEAVNAASACAEEYEESISNMPDGLQSSPVAEECQEKADTLRYYGDDLEGWAPDDEEPDFPLEGDMLEEGEAPEGSDEAVRMACEQEWRDWAQGCVESASEAVGGLDL